MRNWKNWLFPLTTCLIVLGLAVLPLWLSLRADGTLTGVVHSEELREDSNFPARAPELPERIRLLAMEESRPDTLTIMERELEDVQLEEAASDAGKELRSLADAGILPPEAAEEFAGNFSGRRLYVRSQTDLSSASFLHLDAWEKERDVYFSVYLDGETGQALAFQLSGYPMKKFSPDARKTGQAFLDRLGVSYTEKGLFEDGFLSLFHLEESQTEYYVQADPYGILTVYPQLDWAYLDQMEKNNSAAAGYDS